MRSITNQIDMKIALTSVVEKTARTVRRKLIVKPLLTAATLAFSVAAVFGSTSAFAAFTVSNGVKDASGNWHFSNASLGGEFATFGIDDYGLIRFRTNVSQEYLSPSHTSDSYLYEISRGNYQWDYWGGFFPKPYFVQTYSFHKFTTDGESHGSLDMSYGSITKSDRFSASLEHIKYGADGKMVESEKYTDTSYRGSSVRYEHTTPSGTVSGYTSQEKLWFDLLYATMPISGYSVFDFENSFITYSNGYTHSLYQFFRESFSFDTIVGGGSFEGDVWFVKPFRDLWLKAEAGNFDFGVYTADCREGRSDPFCSVHNVREIVDISIALNLPDPDPFDLAAFLKRFQDIFSKISGIFGQIKLPASLDGDANSATAFMLPESLAISPYGDVNNFGLAAANNLSAVPEPETWAMLLAGLVVIGNVARRRNAFCN